MGNCLSLGGLSCLKPKVHGDDDAASIDSESPNTPRNPNDGPRSRTSSIRSPAPRQPSPSLRTVGSDSIEQPDNEVSEVIDDDGPDFDLDELDAHLAEQDSSDRGIDHLPLHSALTDLSGMLPVAVAAHQPGRVRLARPGEQKQPTLRVEASTLEQLRVAQQLIESISSDPSVHMGNQLSDIIETKGESWARVQKMVDWYKKFYDVPPLDPRVLAENALAFKAYDCIHVNARAFVELVARGIDVPAFFVRSGDHAYVLIGNLEAPGAREEDLVVLDLWPRFPMAHTLKDARHKFPLMVEHESPGAYAARLERSNWTMCGWRPGQTGFLDGCDFSGQAVMNSHGVRFDDADASGSDDGNELHDWEADVLREGLGPMHEETSSADTQSPLAQFNPDQYLSSRLGCEDPLRALLPKVWNEWLFSTEHAGRSYVGDAQAEPVSFNEYPRDRWDAWQDAIAQLRLQDSQSGTALSTQDAFLDVPRGTPPDARGGPAGQVS